MLTNCLTNNRIQKQGRYFCLLVAFCLYCIFLRNLALNIVKGRHYEKKNCKKYLFLFIRVLFIRIYKTCRNSIPKQQSVTKIKICLII